MEQITTEQLPGYGVLSALQDAQLTQLFGVRDFFVYEVDFTGLVAATSATQQFSIQSDANFLWQSACMFADIAAAVETDSSRVLPLVSCTLTDQGSGRQLMNSAVPVTSIFGYGSLPFVLQTPRFFRAQTTIGVTLTNFSAATTYNVKLSFIGTKVFNFAQPL